MPEVLTPPLLSLHAKGQDVIHLQSLLAAAGAFEADIDGSFGAATELALRNFQTARKLTVSGTLTAESAALLNWVRWLPNQPRLSLFSPDAAQPLFPQAPKANLAANLPPVLDALAESGLNTPDMTLMALATIRVETCIFLPISEQASTFNTSPGGKPFDLYNTKSGLGNQGAPDGSLYRGRGFVQLTGRVNYEKFGKQLGVDLVANPYLAHRADIAARLLAAFLKNRAQRIQSALDRQQLAEARKLVNGGSNGLADFTATFNQGKHLLAA